MGSAGERANCVKEGSRMHGEERGVGPLGYTEKDFKVCDLCGALNRVSNAECFICGWSGVFNTESEVVQRAMREFEDRYGALSERALAEELLPDERPALGFFANLIHRIKEFLNGRE
jgi:hypothetical protein